MRDLLESLQYWYTKQCDGDWEHQYGIRIETLDNPGWAVQVDLSGTSLSEDVLPEMVEERSSSDWIRYSAENGVFRGFGGPNNLGTILERFFAWADAIN
jgi:immunity protein 53 of polymorphic toxin system